MTQSRAICGTMGFCNVSKIWFRWGLHIFSTDSCLQMTTFNQKTPLLTQLYDLTIMNLRNKSILNLSCLSSLFSCQISSTRPAVENGNPLWSSWHEVLVQVLTEESFLLFCSKLACHIYRLHLLSGLTVAPNHFGSFKSWKTLWPPTEKGLVQLYLSLSGSQGKLKKISLIGLMVNQSKQWFVFLVEIVTPKLDI